MTRQTILSTIGMALVGLVAENVARLRPYLRRAEEGAAMIEYAIIAALIAVACLAAIQALGNGIAAVFGRILGSIAGIG